MSAGVKEFMWTARIICWFCPEASGELPTPRPPAEIINGRVFNKSRGRCDGIILFRGAEKTSRAAAGKNVQQSWDRKIEIGHI